MTPRRVAWSVLVLSLSWLALGCGGPDESGRAGATPHAASAACTGLVPAFGTPVDLRFDTGTHSICRQATTSPSGEVALGVGHSVTEDFQLFTPAGAPAEDPGVIEKIAYNQLNLELDPVLHFTSTGWHGIVHAPPPALGFTTYTAGGTVVSTLSTLNAFVSAPDGRGGSVIGAGATNGSGTIHLAWVNAAGAVTRDVTIDRSPALLLVQWGTGHVLVVATAGTFPTFTTANARWFDGTGHPLTPWFTTHTVVDTLFGRPALHLLRDGRIALSANGVWTVAIHDGTTVVDHAPAWLASRPGTRLATIPGGYAVLTDGPGAGSSATAPKLEVLDANGHSCGVVTPPPGPSPLPTATRTTFAYFVGQDGTLIENSTLGGNTDALGIGIHCFFRWWPRLWVGH
jgi:hypothetical protein